MAEIQAKLNDNQSVQSSRFALEKTIVAQNMWYKEDEDLNRVASTIINKALNLPEVKIVDVEHKSGKAKGKGLVKIELENKDTVSAVLRHKNMLNESEVCEIREIYLHKSKKEEVLMMEHNVDLILCEVGVHDDFCAVAIRIPEEKI